MSYSLPNFGVNSHLCPDFTVRAAPNLPSMASREHPRSLAELPIELQANIAGLVTATSKKPMDDLRSLRATCKSLLGPCRDKDVGRKLALDRVPVQYMQNTDPEGYDVFIRSLAAAGNPATGFHVGIDNIFGRNRSPRPALDELHVLPRLCTEGRPMWWSSSSTGSTAGPMPTALHMRT
jgi:hypothetical protein